jgi:hypothetical protein
MADFSSLVWQFAVATWRAMEKRFGGTAKARESA